MPAYNAQAYVEEAIRSVLNQTETDFEFIIVNDGSTDGTRSIIDRIADIDGRLVVLHLPHNGLVSSLNRGLAEARGAFVARMDADDLCRPTRFARQLAYMRSHPECVAVGSHIRRFGSLDSTGAAPGRQVYEPGVRQDITIFHPTAFVRAHAISGGYSLAFERAEDSELWRRVIRAGEIHNIPEILLDYRHHASQSSRENAALQAFRNNVAVSLYSSRADVEPLLRTLDRPLTADTVEKIAAAHPEPHVRNHLRLDIAEYHLAQRESALYARQLLRASPALVQGRFTTHARLLARRLLHRI